MLKLQLRHYRAVHAVRAHGSVSAAADALGLTQSALSHQIAEAERRVGRKLFSRAGRRLILTTSGELLAVSADTILREAERLEHFLVSSDEGQDEIIRIGTYAYSCYRWLPQFLKQVRSSMPRVDFEFVADTTKPPLKSVGAGEADLGIAAGNLTSRVLDITLLFDDELVAVIPSRHRLAKRDVLWADDFLNDPFITYSAFYDNGFEEDLLWKPAACRPKKWLRAGLTEAVIELVRAEFGLSILSRWAVAPYLQTGGDLVSIRVTDQGLPLRWNALRRRNHPNAERLAGLSTALQVWCQTHFKSAGKKLHE